MPMFKNHTVGSRTKLLLVGDSGSGKTGSLATLANAGYNLRIADFDNGLDVLSDYLDPDAVGRVHYFTFRDSLDTANAYNDFVKKLTSWKDDDVDFGAVQDWSEDDVLVIDSMTFMANAAMRAVLKQNGKRLNDQPAIQHWGEAGRNVETIIQFLTSDEIKCNVVFTSHVQYYDDAAGGRKAYPVVLGSKLPTIVGRYFNTILRIDVKPSRDGGTRILRTVSDYKMDLKNPAPSIILPEEDLDLAKIFEGIQSNAQKKAGK